MKSKPNQV